MANLCHQFALEYIATDVYSVIWMWLYFLSISNQLYFLIDGMAYEESNPNHQVFSTFKSTAGITLSNVHTHTHIVHRSDKMWLLWIMYFFDFFVFTRIRSSSFRHSCEWMCVYECAAWWKNQINTFVKYMYWAKMRQRSTITEPNQGFQLKNWQVYSIPELSYIIESEA